MSADQLDLPITSVTRILRSTLPPNIQVSKEVKHSFARSAGLFILYLTHVSNQLAQSNKRTNINAEDIIGALIESDLEQLVEPVTQFLKDHRKQKPTKSGKNDDNIIPTKRGSATTKKKAVKRKAPTTENSAAKKKTAKVEETVTDANAQEEAQCIAPVEVQTSNAMVDDEQLQEIDQNAT